MAVDRSEAALQLLLRWRMRWRMMMMRRSKHDAVCTTAEVDRALGGRGAICAHWVRRGLGILNAVFLAHLPRAAGGNGTRGAHARTTRTYAYLASRCCHKTVITPKFVMTKLSLRVHL